MELLYASCVGVLVACGVFLILRARTFPVVLGLTMFSYAVNLFLFSVGRLSLNKAAVLGYGSEYADPLPQALVLTAIVIGFAMTAFVVILAIRGRVDLGNDHVDGKPDKIIDNKGMDNKVKDEKAIGRKTDIEGTQNTQGEL